MRSRVTLDTNAASARTAVGARWPRVRRKGRRLYCLLRQRTHRATVLNARLTEQADPRLSLCLIGRMCFDPPLHASHHVPSDARRGLPICAARGVPNSWRASREPSLPYLYRYVELTLVLIGHVECGARLKNAITSLSDDDNSAKPVAAPTISSTRHYLSSLSQTTSFSHPKGEPPRRRRSYTDVVS